MKQWTVLKYKVVLSTISMYDSVFNTLLVKLLVKYRGLHSTVSMEDSKCEADNSCTFHLPIIIIGVLDASDTTMNSTNY